MTPGDRVTLPDGRGGIVWKVAGGFVWVNLDGAHFQIEQWRAVDVIVKRDDLSGQLRLPLEEL